MNSKDFDEAIIQAMAEWITESVDVCDLCPRASLCATGYDNEPKCPTADEIIAHFTPED